MLAPCRTSIALVSAVSRNLLDPDLFDLDLLDLDLLDLNLLIETSARATIFL